MQEKPDFTPLSKLTNTNWLFNWLSAYLILLMVFLGIILSSGSKFFIFIGSLALIAEAIYMYSKYKKQNNGNKVAFAEFASLNNYTYTEENKSVNESGSLYKQGHSNKEKYIFEGEFRGLPMRLSNFEYSTGSGKNREDFQLRVMRLTLPIRQPHMVIDCLIEAGDNAESSLPISFDDSQKIKLEGDFYKYFDLYAVDKYAVDALSVIAPDAMDAMMRMSAICDIEIIDNYVYFMWPEDSFTKNNYETVFETVDLVMGEIQKKLSSRSPIQPKTMPANSLPASGVYLKKSNKIYPILIGVALFIVYMSPHLVPAEYQSFAFIGPFIVIGSIFAVSMYKEAKIDKGRKAYFSSKNVHRR